LKNEQISSRGYFFGVPGTWLTNTANSIHAYV